MNKPKKCRSCFYRAAKCYTGIACDYISITGTSRPCEPGDECIVYRKSKRRAKARPDMTVMKNTDMEEIV